MNASMNTKFTRTRVDSMPFQQSADFIIWKNDCLQRMKNRIYLAELRRTEGIDRFLDMKRPIATRLRTNILRTFGV